MSNLEELKAKRDELTANQQQWEEEKTRLRQEHEKEQRDLSDEIQMAVVERLEIDRQIAELSAPPVDRSNQCTTTGESPEAARAQQTEEEGQHKSYIILCEEERAKGFVRPFRDKYIHVGVGGHEISPTNPTKHGLKGGCGVLTRMSREIAETYQRSPGFYSSTFCVGCNRHLPVAEFVWEDGEVVGS